MPNSTAVHLANTQYQGVVLEKRNKRKSKHDSSQRYTVDLGARVLPPSFEATITSTGHKHAAGVLAIKVV